MWVCTHFHSAIQAAPQLWPTVVLAVPLHAAVTPVDMGGRYESRMVHMAHKRDFRSGAGLVNTALQLSPQTRRVRLEGPAGLEQGQQVRRILHRASLQRPAALLSLFLSSAV
jgi:hypothetical protein